MSRLLVLLLVLLLGLALTALVIAPAAAHPAASGPADSVARAAPTGKALSPPALALRGARSAPTALWTPAGAMVQPVDSPGGGAFAGTRGYVPGGFISSTLLHDNMQIYVPTSNTWFNDVQVMPVGVGWADAAVCADSAGRVHVVNGVDGAFLYAAHQVYTTTNPLGSRWGSYSYPQLPTGEAYYSQGSGCAFIGSGGVEKMYLFGGYGVIDPNPTAGVLDATWVWDPATDTWADTGFSMNDPRMWFAYTDRNGTPEYAFASGGMNDLSTFTAISSTERFTPAGGWIVRPSMPEGRLGHGMSIAGTTVVVYGGGTGDSISGFTLLDTTIRCSSNGACGSWSPLNKQLATARWFFGWFGSGGVSPFAGVVAGGLSITGTLGAAERLP